MNTPKPPPPLTPIDSPAESTSDDLAMSGFCVTLWLREQQP
jgi:hypothetical protein